MTNMPRFLTLPFSKAELIEQQRKSPHPDFEDNLYHIREGYIYHPGIYGYKLHAGVDYYVSYGTNVYAPCGGYVCASYNFQRATDEEGNIRQQDGKNISYGLGFCTQLYHPPSNLFILFGHLSYLARGIPYSEPKLMNDERGHPMYSVTNFSLSREHRQSIGGLSSCKKVLSGQFIGQIGLSR